MGNLARDCTPGLVSLGLKDFDRPSRGPDKEEKENESMNDQPEIRLNMPFDRYLAHPGTSASLLKAVAHSPRLARWKADHDDEPTASMSLGTAAHMAILESRRFSRECVVFHGIRRGKAWDEFRDEHSAHLILTERDMEGILAMQQAVFQHPVAGPLVQGGQPEVSILAPGRKCRVDYLAGGHWVELKSTADADPERFPAHLVRMGWHLQLSWYHDLIRDALGRELPGKLVVVETKAPFDVVVYTLGQDVLEAGRRAYRRALDLLEEAQRTGRWHGYADDCEVPLRLPPWAIPAVESETVFTLHGEEVSFND